MKKFLAQAYIWTLLLLLYAPIIIIMVFSFTESKVLGNWTGFSTKLYSNLFTVKESGTTFAVDTGELVVRSAPQGVSSSLFSAIENTLLIALVASIISTALGSVAAIGIFNLKGKKKQAMYFLNNIPMLNPDIITGISLFILFVAVGLTQGYATIILAHITFCTPYVVLCVMPKLIQMNPNTYEAALDLGATPLQAMWKVIVPHIRGGMVSGFLLSFTLSIDDFAVTLFTKGNEGLDTLSTYIYADARKGGLTPELRALSTIIFVIVLVSLTLINVYSIYSKRKNIKKQYWRYDKAS